MARLKNALRGHFILPYDGEETAPTTGWLRLAKYVEDISADNNESVEDIGFYDGDGTPEQDVVAIALGYSFSGHFDESDPAQKLIADMEDEIGSARKVWHRRVNAMGTEEKVGVATVSGIVAGGGPATEYEAFECNIRWDRKPVKNVITPEG